jgi:hypothetical protein
MQGRLVTLVVSELQYEGDGIGRDLTLVVEIGGGRLEINKKLAPGDTRQ